MRLFIIRFVAWTAVACGFGVSASLWGNAPDRPGGGRSEPALPTAAYTATAVALVRPDSSVRLLAHRNPFRLHRSRATRRFGESVQQAPAEVAASPPPELTLVGVVGPPWVALVEGLPGRQTAVAIVQGTGVDDFMIEAVRGDTVVITGLDTTWTLIPKVTW